MTNEIRDVNLGTRTRPMLPTPRFPDAGKATESLRRTRPDDAVDVLRDGAIHGIDLLVDGSDLGCFLFSQTFSSLRHTFNVKTVAFELIWVSEEAFIFNG